MNVAVHTCLSGASTDMTDHGSGLSAEVQLTGPGALGLWSMRRREDRGLQHHDTGAIVVRTTSSSVVVPVFVLEARSLWQEKDAKLLVAHI